MAALQTMAPGSLKSEYREQSAGVKSGPYFKHQVWRAGANGSQRIAPADAPALATAVATRQKFETLAAHCIDRTVAHTRHNQFPDALEKKRLPARSPKQQRSRS